MRYVGGNTVFTIDRLFSEHGILAPRCFAEFGDGMHFVVTHGDVIVHDGNTARSIANDIVRNHIFDEIDSVYYKMARRPELNSQKNSPSLPQPLQI